MKPRTFKAHSLLFVMMLTSILLLNALLQPSHISATTTDCSDVYTPLSSFVLDSVSANKSFYLTVAQQTNVPWELLAAIHYRETSFSHTNPSNGQGIFQFVNGEGGPYPPGPVSDQEFIRQLTFMANQLQNDYVFRNSPNPAFVNTRKLQQNEPDIALVKNVLYSYNGRSTQYANQAATYGYDQSSQPYEGSPYVMNRFDCPRARMGIITQDYGSIDSTDTRYGAFTVFARLRGDSYWFSVQSETSNYTPFIRTNQDGKIYMLGDNESYYYVTSASQLQAYGYGSIFKKLLYADTSYLQGLTPMGDLPVANRFGNGSEVYTVDAGTKHYYTYDRYVDYGSPAVGQLPSFMSYIYQTSTPINPIMREISHDELYYITGSRRHYIGGPYIYTSMGYSSMSWIEVSSYFLGRISEGYPLLRAGTLIKTSDTSQYGVVTTDGQASLQNFNPSSAAILTIPAYTSASTTQDQMTRTNPSLGLKVKDSSGYYLLDQSTKYSITSDQITDAGMNAADFIQANSYFLSQFSRVDTTGPNILIRPINRAEVYKIIGGKLWFVPSLAEFKSLGLDMNNVINLSASSINDLFANNGDVLLAPGALFRATGATEVYIVDVDNYSHYVPYVSFTHYNFRLQDVISVQSLSAAASYIRGGDLSPVTRASDNSAWLVDSGTRQWIDPNIADKFAASTAPKLPARSLNPLRIGNNATKFIRAGSSPNVYIMDSGATHLLSISSYYQNGGTDWSDVTSVSQSLFNSLPSGQAWL